MGLAPLDVADVIRPHPEVVAYLQHAKDEGFLEGLLAGETQRITSDHSPFIKMAGLLGMEAAGIEPAAWSLWRGLEVIPEV